MIKDAIREAMENIGGIVTISKIKDWNGIHFPEYRNSDIGTAMADLTVVGNQTSQYAQESKFLQRIGRGCYTLV